MNGKKIFQIFFHFFIIAFFAFLGGASTNYLLLNSGTAIAGQRSSASYSAVSDAQNTRGIETYVYNGWPAQNFYGQDDNIRLQQGLYNAPGEAGLPLTGFSDNHGNLRLLLRLAGPNESPVIIMKDRQHRDRVVLGLGMADAGEEPFLAVIDASGRKKMLFGNY